jgi:UDP-N-acetylmuramyl pentapeptide phosphotransferase/UDP-N-acetylglucosamine-1-phosphate transferase
VTSWLIIAGASAAVLTLGLTPAVIHLLEHHNVLDIPNERSSHRRDTVRGAGIGFSAGWTLVASALVLWMPVPRGGSATLLGLCIALTALGFADDVRTVAPGIRLSTQIALCGLAVVAGVSTPEMHGPGGASWQLGLLAGPLCTIFLVASVNVFNFMDGIDGLTATQTAVSALVLAGGAATLHVWPVALLAVAVAGAMVGFLPFNWSPARCFMGDAGSYFCGAVIGGLLLLGERNGIPVLFTGLALLPFLLDVGLTLLTRVARREAVWRPHRQHFYQRLVRNGWAHDRITLLYALTGGALGAAGVLYVAHTMS